MFDPEEKDNNDFFDGPDLPDAETEVEKKKKEPELTPDDPLYWERESEWEHLRVVRSSGKKMRNMMTLWGVVGLLAIGVCICLYLRLFSPYIEEAVQYGYVEGIEKRGTLFKTYEGVLLPYKELHDTTRVYKRDFIFSTGDEHVASDLKRLQKAGLPARVEYKTYHATVPWRGESKTVVVKVDTADARKILPPEWR